MIIDIEEGLLDLQQALINTFGVDPGVFDTDVGKVMGMEIALIYLRHVYHDYVNRGSMSDATVMTGISSALYKGGETEAQVKAKSLADMLVRYEAADGEVNDDGPEAEAYFKATEFFEEAFRDIEEIGMADFRKQGTDVIYKLGLPSGAAGHKIITAELIINDATTVRMACGKRSVFTDMIRSIVLG